MASKYGRAMRSTARAKQAIQSGLASAGKKQIGVKKFELEKQLEFEEKAMKGSQKYQTAKTIGGLIGGGLALVTGTAPIYAALAAGGGTIAGGMAGKSLAKKEMEGFGWYGNKRMDLERGMNKQTIESALVNAVLAGVGAGGGEKVAGEAGKEVAKESTIKLSEANVKAGVKQADITKYGWKGAEQKNVLAREWAASSGPRAEFGKKWLKGDIKNWASEFESTFGSKWTNAGQEVWDETLLGEGSWATPVKGKAAGSFGEIDTAWVGKPEWTTPSKEVGYKSMWGKSGVENRSFKQAGSNIKSAFRQFMPKKGQGAFKNALTLSQLLGHGDPDEPWHTQQSVI